MVPNYDQLQSTKRHLCIIGQSFVICLNLELNFFFNTYYSSGIFHLFLCNVSIQITCIAFGNIVEHSYLQLKHREGKYFVLCKYLCYCEMVMTFRGWNTLAWHCTDVDTIVGTLPLKEEKATMVTEIT